MSAMKTKRMNNYSKVGGTKKRLFVGGTVYRGREGEREKVNVAQFFSFWLDIDVGEREILACV